MSVAEILVVPEFEPEVAAPALRLVTPLEGGRQFRRGESVVARREARQLRVRRRKQGIIGLVLLGALYVATSSAPALGGTTNTGLSTLNTNSSLLVSGQVYVVQSGDTIASIARLVNPYDPNRVEALLHDELHSSVVLPGEHLLIP
jgi:LysM repeat protein